MKIELKVKRLVELKQEILKEAKGWKGDACPLTQFDNSDDFSLNHGHLSEFFTGLGMIIWDCPFCNETFSE